jgi:anti-sigma B factor antagonist
MLGVPVVSPSGDLVRDTLGALSREIEPHLAGSGPGLVLDLADVKFVSSEGLGLFIRVGKTLEEQGRVLALAALPRQVERVMRAIGLDQVFPMFRGVAEARAWVAQRAAHEL